MTPRTIARRYANALFDVAQRRGTIDAASNALTAFSSLMAGHDELRARLGSPLVPTDRKRAIVTKLVQAGGPHDDDVTRLLLLLADRDRLGLMADVAASFAERLGKLRNIIPADVTTAVALGHDRLEALAGSLRKATGSSVTITEHVDPKILGGVIARVGSVVFDGSVARQLERLKQKLLV